MVVELARLKELDEGAPSELIGSVLPWEDSHDEIITEPVTTCSSVSTNSFRL